MAIETRHLRLLCAISDVGSLSRAAAELGMSQPSVTASLRRLEARFSGPLFVRSHLGVTPTDLGLRLISRARIALAEIDQLEAIGATPDEGGPVRIGLSQLAATPVMVRELEDRLGERTTFAVDASAAVLTQALKHGRHDLSVITVSDDLRQELPADVHTRILQPAIPVFVALPATHRLARQSEIDLADLASDAWIGPPGADDGSLAELRTVCAAAGFVPDVRYTVPPGNGRRIIAETDAVQLVEPACPDGDGVVSRPLVGDPIRLRLVLAWRKARVGHDVPDLAHRAVMDVYSRFARSNPAYVEWWRRRRGGSPWVGQLDPVFAED